MGDIMPKKKIKNKQPIVPKKKERIRSARRWIKTYTGENVVKEYRERYRVNVECAIHELVELGYEFEDGYVERALRAEERRIQKLWAEKEKKNHKEDYNDFQDDTFAFIAGHTPGGAPYGTTWEELGLEPYGDILEIDDDVDEF